MSHNDSIINLLNLKDENIIFDENFCIDGIVKGVKCKVFNATLTYKPKACYSCGHIFDKKIIKYGFKTSDIKIPNVSGFNAYLRLRKQRYFCKHCNSTFILKTNIVKKNCFISNNTKLAIALSAKENQNTCVLMSLSQSNPQLGLCLLFSVIPILDKS
jgi:transposase